MPLPPPTTAALVLHCEPHLLAANKPPGLLTQPAPGAGDSLETRLRAWVKAEFHRPGAVFLEAVHRLDRPASGVVLFARTSKALTRLNEQVRERAVRKLYWALVTQPPPAAAGELVHHLRHGSHEAELCRPGDAGAREARLHYRVVEPRHGTWVLLAIELETGRYHQIRAQLAAVGCPIVGDMRYGGAPAPGLAGIALHHRALTIAHPISRAPLTFTAPPPPGWPE